MEDDSCSAPEAPYPTESEPLCEGDTKIFYNVLPPSLADAFERVRQEVSWQRMSHQGGEVPRLVAVQGTVEEDDNDHGDASNKTDKKSRIIPIYRHPSDSSPPLAAFTPAVSLIRSEVERKLGHPVNHVLIQLYRSGTDYISEHSDKSLDICHGSYIANMSLGAERTMVFRTKRQQQTSGEQQGSSSVDMSTMTAKRQTTRAPLPHNSLCKMGLRTNASWLHGIRQDKRREAEKRDEEKAFEGCRISLTFRAIGTFLVEEAEDKEVVGVSPADDDTAHHDSASSSMKIMDGTHREGQQLQNRVPLIFGQGAKAKTRREARPVVNGPTAEAVSMIRGFGRENQEDGTRFNWDSWYGTGFDVLHVTASPRVFFCRGGSSNRADRDDEGGEGCGDWVEDARVGIGLREMGVGFARGVLGDNTKKENNQGGNSPEGDGGMGEGGRGEMNSRRKNRNIMFVDVDEGRTVVKGSGEVLRYLERVYRRGTPKEAGEEHRRGGGDDATENGRQKIREVFEAVLDESDKLAAVVTSEEGKEKEVQRLLASWDKRAQEGQQQQKFIAGSSQPSIADFALWPVLHRHIARQGDRHEALAEFPNLAAYYELMMARNSTKEVLKVSR